jgi:ribosomal-protein-alanine N-acetyltransferase
MQSGTFRLDAAREADLPAIMELEDSGFDAAIREAESVFRAKLALFPEGFVVLREASTGLARGYLCAERWAEAPKTEEGPEALAAAFRLGHDPAERHDPKGRVAYLASMTLDPALRGAGLGALLFDGGRNLVLRRARGIERELLLVNEAWAAARRIYARSGFVEGARLAGFFPGGKGEAPQGAILMERKAVFSDRNAAS